MLLLLLHLAEDGVLLDLDEGTALVLAEAEPELLDTLALLGGAGAPDLVGLGLGLCLIRSMGLAGLLGGTGVGGGGRWMSMGLGGLLRGLRGGSIALRRLCGGTGALWGRRRLGGRRRLLVGISHGLFPY